MTPPSAPSAATPARGARDLRNGHGRGPGEVANEVAGLGGSYSVLSPRRIGGLNDMALALRNVLRRLPIAATLFVCSAASAASSGGHKRYYLELVPVTVKDQVKPEVAKVAALRVEAE